MALPIQEQKSEVFGQIAAIKVLTDDVNSQKGNLWGSLNSISQDPINFLVDLIKELVGYEALRDAFSNTMASSLNTIEDKIKYAIKLKLKELLSCGVNPSIPDDFKYSGTGYDFKVTDFDYTDIFKLDPASTYGDFIYYDIASQLNSTDTNTFLYYTIQNENIEYNWGSQVGYNDITTFKFKPNSGGQTNIINIKASDYYSTNKKLNDWNNDYVNSIDILPDAQFFTKILDNTFNVFSGVINKTQSQSEAEEKINAIIDKMLDTDPDETINDSFFEFNNIELREISEKAKLKSLGINKLDSCYGYVQKTLPINVSNSINDIEQASSFNEKKIAIDNAINNFASNAGSLGNDTDKYNIKLNFFVELIRGLVKSIIAMILSPKLIAIFLVNFKITQGGNATFNGIDGLLKVLKSLFKEIIDQVKGIVVSILLEIVMKEIKKLQSQVASKISKELVKNRQKVLLSLIGVPQDIIRLTTKF